MPKYTQQIFELEFSRKSLIVDSNVLYAAFSSRDYKKNVAKAFLELWDGDVLVSSSGLVETWGMLIGRDKHWPGGSELVQWLFNPGNCVYLLPQSTFEARNIMEGVLDYRIDCVDGFLMKVAHEITCQCSFQPYILIATFDFRDYLTRLKQKDLNFRLINPDTLEEFP